MMFISLVGLLALILGGCFAVFYPSCIMLAGVGLLLMLISFPFLEKRG